MEHITEVISLSHGTENKVLRRKFGNKREKVGGD
jgi:hypothetical protein